jgi:hypothetical protein
MRRKLYRHSSVVRRLKPHLYHPFDHISDLRSLKSASGLGGIYGIPRLLWVAGDGNDPTISPFKNPLTLDGSPSIEITPYELADGSSVIEEVHAGNSNRRTTELLNPGIDDDFVILAMGKYGQDGGGYYSYYFGTRDSGRGIRLGLRHDTNQMYCFLNGDTQKNLGSPENGIPNGYFITVTVVNRNDKGVTAFNGDFGSLVDVSGNGSLANNQGVGIASLPGGGGDIVNRSSIIALAVWIDDNIAPFWETDSYAPVKELTHQLSGIYPEKGNSGIFTRNSAASWQNKNGVWAIASTGLSRSGDSEGMLIEPQRQNDVYNTVNPQVTTGWSVTGGTHTAAVDDKSALESADLLTFGPDVHRFVPGGSDQVIYGGATTGDTNAQCIMVAIRGDAGGESVDLGLRDASTGTVQNLQTIICTTSYQVITVENQTPSDTDMQWCLDCDAGDTIYFVASQLEEGAVLTTQIPNRATAAALVRPQDVFDLSETPDDVQGSIELTITPQNWGGSDAGTPTILTRATGSPALIYIDGSGNWASDLDGTTTLSSGVAAADGTSHTIRLRWVGDQMSIDVNGTRISATYDGALDGSGVWRLAADAPVRVKDLKVYRKGGE